MPKIVLLSGLPYSGKSTLANKLEKQHGFHVLKSSELIAEQRTDDMRSRSGLINAGDQNDDLDGGRWLVDAVKKKQNETGAMRICLDRVRKPFQLHAFRQEWGWQIYHIHVDAPREVLSERFNQTSKDEDLSFDGLIASDEPYLDELRREADLVVDTARSTPGDVLVRVASRLKLLSNPLTKCVDVLVGGQFGSEGKGQVAAYLAREYDVLVRVGGPNAGHTVMSENGKFTYHHLPSGTKDCDAQVLIGAGAVINPEKILEEIAQVGIGPDRLGIDYDAMIIESSDIATEEAGLRGAIGSTAQGVGVAAARKITDRGNRRCRLAKNVEELKPFLKKVVYELDNAYASGKRVLLEGTQGSGLSIHHGDYPYVTSRDTNVAGCLAEAGISPARVDRIIMVCRTYPIRVASPKGGTSGDLSREISLEEICQRSGVDVDEAKEAEKTSTTGRSRRFGEFDWYLFRKSCSLNAPTDIVLTFADYISVQNRKARRFEQLTKETILFIEELERLAHAPVSLISTRFDERSIIDRRNWGRVRGDGKN